MDSKIDRLINKYFPTDNELKKVHGSTLNLEINRLCDKSVSREIKLFLLTSFHEVFLTSCGC